MFTKKLRKNKKRCLTQKIITVKIKDSKCKRGEKEKKKDYVSE